MVSYSQGEDGALSAERPAASGIVLSFKAERIAEERTGVHARVSILANDRLLAYSFLNVDRSEDRIRLSNQAHKVLAPSLNGTAVTYTATFLGDDLLSFCDGLWAAHVEGTMPELMAGDADPKPPVFMLHPYVLEGGGTILFAPPGRGKSYLSMLWAVSIDSGCSQFFQVHSSPVLFVNLERSRLSLRTRLGSVNRVLGLEADRALLTLNARGRALNDVLPAIKRAVKENSVGCVFLDSISRSGMGDLTENQPVNKIIDALNGACESWVALAHTPRGDESHTYGSIHFEAGADVVVKLLSEQDEGGPLGIGLQITKENDIGKQPLKVLALEFGPAGLRAARFARKGEFEEIERGKKSTLKEDVREYLLREGKAGAAEIAEATGHERSSVARTLAGDSVFQSVGRDGLVKLYGVAGMGS